MPTTMQLMKFFFIAVILLSHTALFAQSYETVTSIEIKPGGAPASKSYIVNTYGKILPGITISAAATGPFFLKANPQAAPIASIDQNFIKTETVLVPGIANEDNMPLNIPQVNINYDYLDGLGRKSQSVTVKGSFTQNDIIVPIEYDIHGRKAKDYMLYTSNQRNGAFRNGALNEQSSFYISSQPDIPSDSRPYTENVFEPSPLNRVTKSYGAGTEWKTVDKGITTYTKVNQASENIIKWKFYTGSLPVQDGVYGSNQLFVEEITDEEGHLGKSYKNLLGQTILNRTGNGTTWYDTYYIYSPAGLLMVVIPPEGVSRLSTEFSADTQSFLDRWCFQYQYDEEQRVIAKRVPGSKFKENTTDTNDGWTYIVYDKWNRIVLEQDADQRTRNEYVFTKYDRFNRPIISGIYTTSTSIGSLRSTAATTSGRFENEPTTTTDYTLTLSFPTSGISANDIRVVNYYDSYNFLNISGWDAEGNSFSYVNISGYPQKTGDASNQILTSVKGHITGTKTHYKVNVNGVNRWLNSVTYYDKKYRAAQTIAENHLGGVIRITTNTDFTGRTEKQKTTNTFSNLTTEELFTYDHAGRLLTVRHSINGSTPVIMISNRYNELGNLVEKNIHSSDNGATFLQSVDRKYNVRGWLTSINNSALTPEMGETNSDLFGLELQYNPATTTNIIYDDNESFETKKFYDGNISSMKWKIDTRNGTAQEKIYGFDYDELSRFKKAHYAVRNGNDWNVDGGMFDEIITPGVSSSGAELSRPLYDKNGNIHGIRRNAKVQNAKTTIDNLTFDYTINGKQSNRLIAMEDVSNHKLGFSPALASQTEEYKYYPNGNLKFDHNKQISLINYNYLNLPTLIQFTRQDLSVDEMEYTYDGLGNKLSTAVRMNGSPVWKTDYVAGFQYDNSQLSFFSSREGRIINNNGNYEYEYFIKDLHGNIRVGFGPLKETLNYRATMELALASDEEDPTKEGFKNISNRRINPGSASLNYTKPSDKVVSPDRSAKVNANSAQSTGPAKLLRVLSGDAVYMEVFAKYTQSTGSSAVILPAVLGAAVNAAFGITVSESPTLYNGISSNAAAAAGGILAGSVQPKAYLAFLFFDDNLVYQPQGSGAKGITTSAFNSFEKLDRSFTADRNGYLFVYVASESDVSTANVYFDEFYVVHQKNNTSLQVTQASDYYPFGLSFNEYNADRLKIVSTTPAIKYEPIVRNRYRYQGQELQKDLELGWYQFKYRMYDPAIGKFSAVDPLSQKFLYNSPFAFQENKLGLGTELEGAELQSFVGPAVAYHYTYGSADGDIGFGDFLGGTALMVREMFFNATPNRRTTYAVRDYLANEIDHAMNSGERYQEALANQQNVDKIRTDYELKKFETKIELIQVGMEWWAFAAGGAQGALESAVMSQATKVFALKASSIRFTQTSVNGYSKAVAAVRSRTYDPIDVVLMRDGMASSIDNTRLLAAQKEGLETINARLHAYDDPLPLEMPYRFENPNKPGEFATTWGEAIEFRINRQNAEFRTQYSGSGAFDQPMINSY